MEHRDLKVSTIHAARYSCNKGAARPLIIFLVVLIVGCVAAGIAGGMYLLNTYSQIKDVENSQNIVPKIPSSDSSASANQDDSNTGKIDFNALKESNPDIYAWIYIPNTHVNYPVCQNPEQNDYYLSHNATGAESEVGAIFSEAQFNHANFNDKVTVLYGHNGFADTMFSDLHEYERQEYLDEHDRVYLFTPDRVYTYQIFSTFSAGERHIMDAFNFQSDEGFMTFVNYLKDPGAIDQHVEDVDIKATDKILVLSTCSSGVLESQGRYLVCGVLINDQPAE